MYTTITVSTAQEAFDRVVDRLFDGRGQAYNGDEGLCYYRRPGDLLPCAIGALLETDDDEGWTGVRAAVHGLLPGMSDAEMSLDEDAQRFIENHVELLTRLQGIHDTSAYWAGDMPSAQMVIELVQAAKEFKLNLNALTKRSDHPAEGPF